MKTLTFVATFLICFAIQAEERSPEERALAFMSTSKMGVCASVMDKAPYLSLMPYALDKGQPFVFISDLAQHTDNINKNGKVSFLIMKRDDKNIFNSARITMQGKMVKIDSDKEHKRLSKIYIAKFPKAKMLLDFADFNFYRLEITSIHFIGGFGDINWLDVDDYKKAAK